LRAYLLIADNSPPEAQICALLSLPWKTRPQPSEQLVFWDAKIFNPANQNLDFCAWW